MRNQACRIPVITGFIILALVYSNHAQSATSDDFNTPALDSKWTFYDPLANSKLTATGTQASIFVPAGSAHNPGTAVLNAPRIKQAADNTDFNLIVKFDSSLSAGYQMQGITVEQNDTHLLCFSFLNDGSDIRLLSASFDNGTSKEHISKVISTGAPLFLRVQRVGNQWTESYSYNGSSWTIAGTYSYPLAVSSVGLFADNAGSPISAHTALVDSFIINGMPGRKGQDTTVPFISNIELTAVTGNTATIAWTTDEAANSAINYGLSNDYESFGNDAAMVTNHSLTLTGLTPNTLYRYRINSTDASSNTGNSNELTFKTKNIAQHKTIINWTRLSSATGDLPVPPVSNGQSGFKVADLDKNGQIDYLLTLWEAAETMVWYRQLGSKFEKYVIDTEKKGISHSDEFRDIDNDGDLDIIIGDASKANTINWWENPYPNYNPKVPWVRRVVRDTGPNFYHDSIWGDFDGDGTDEFIAWNQAGYQLLMFEVPTDPKSSGPWPVTQIFSWTSGLKSQYRGSDAIDINLDGKIDFVGGCGWFEHTGGTNFVRHSIDEAHGYSSVEAGQLIPGGRPEVICYNELENGPLNMYEWTGTTWRVRALFPYLGRGHTLQIADINADGKLDIMVSEQAKWNLVRRPPNNPDARLFVLYGDGSGNFHTQTVYKGQGYLEGQISDIDGDGDVDLITPPFRHNIPLIDIWINEGIAKEGDVVKPEISDVEVSESDTTARVTWNTNELSGSTVNYGLDNRYGASHVSELPQLSHSMVLTNLLPDTLYHYQITARDNSGNVVQSRDLTFTTDRKSHNPSGLSSDHFTGPLDSSKWIFYDPLGKSSLSTTGTQAAIPMPAGSAHNLWTDAFNAPRLRQAAKNTDFTLEVKFDSIVATEFHQQGLAIEQKDDELIRFDYSFDGSATRIFSASFVNGKPTTHIDKVISNSAPLYLKVNRTGNQWAMSYSHNGIDWKVAGTYEHRMVVNSVAIFGGNNGTLSSAPYTTLIDHFLVVKPPGFSKLMQSKITYFIDLISNKMNQLIYFIHNPINLLSLGTEK